MTGFLQWQWWLQPCYRQGKIGEGLPQTCTPRLNLAWPPLAGSWGFGKKNSRCALVSCSVMSEAVLGGLPAQQTELEA